MRYLILVGPQKRRGPRTRYMKSESRQKPGPFGLCNGRGSVRRPLVTVLYREIIIVVRSASPELNIIPQLEH